MSAGYFACESNSSEAERGGGAGVVEKACLMSDLSIMFRRVVETLGKENLDFLLIGGMAVNYYGYTRATADIDFMVAVNKVSQARRALSQAGFTNVLEQENVLFFHWPDQPVRVDLLKVDEETFARLLQKSVAIEVHAMPLRVPALDDLIAMKLFALKHGGAKRMAKDMVDVVQLTLANNLDLEQTIKPLALRYADEVWYQQIEMQVLDWGSDESTRIT